MYNSPQKTQVIQREFVKMNISSNQVQNQTLNSEKIYIGGVSPNPINFRHSFPPTIVFIPIETIGFILNAHIFDYAGT